MRSAICLKPGICSLLLGIAGTLGQSTLAQTGTTAIELEEVIITASRRETLLTDTPAAVSAYSAGLMEELNVISPFNYQSLVPSLSYQEFPNRLSIRGIGRFSNALGISPGVAIYNDGIFTAEATSLSTQPINIERSEILRGPQGTLYGRNTTGGAVNIITKRPTSEFHGDVRVTVGVYDWRTYAAVISGPITDALRYKLHVIDNERDGLQKNLAGKDLRTSNSTYYEAQLQWDITDRLDLWLEWAHYDNHYIQGAAPDVDPFDCSTFWVAWAAVPNSLSVRLDAPTRHWMTRTRLPLIPREKLNSAAITITRRS